MASDEPRARVDRRAEGSCPGRGVQLSGEELTAYLEREGVKLAEFEHWRIALDEGGQGLRLREQAHSPARARARAQGEGAGRSCGAAHSKKKCRIFTRTRTTTPTRRTRSDPRRDRRGAVLGRASGARVSSGRHLGSHHRALACTPTPTMRRCGPHRRPRNALSPGEEAQVVTVLTSSRYARLVAEAARASARRRRAVPRVGVDDVPRAASPRASREEANRASRTHVTRAAPVHRATRPNQVWSWDITWLPTTVRGVYLYLYLVMDVWSRRIVGWRIAERNRQTLPRSSSRRRAATATSIHAASCCTPTTAQPMRGSTMISTLQWLGDRPVLQPPARLRRQSVLRGARSAR